MESTKIKDYAFKGYFSTQLMIAAKAGKSVYDNEVNKLNNLPITRPHRSIIQRIFQTYWVKFQEICKLKERELRPAIIVNVEKLISCGDWSKGFSYYECPKCFDFHIVGHTCKSRFCPRCTNRYREDRTTEISKKILAHPHRQFVLSIAEELRDYFRKYRELYDILFTSANEAFKWLLTGKSKIAVKEQRDFGYVAFLHSFGRGINVNPHLHLLICEAYMNKDNKLINYPYFNYDTIRKSFMKQLLGNIYDYLKKNASEKVRKNFYYLKDKLYKKYPDGFYAHGPKLKQNTRVSIKNVTNYIARYVSHPAIAESRILNVDWDKHTVTWYYDPHEDDEIDDPNLKKGRQIITESVFKFMGKLVSHIPDKNFRNIRYYGFYSNRTTKDTSIHKQLYYANEIKSRKSNNSWINHLIKEFKYNPLLCHCGTLMVLSLESSYFPTHKQGGG